MSVSSGSPSPTVTWTPPLLALPTFLPTVFATSHQHHPANYMSPPINLIYHLSLPCPQHLLQEGRDAHLSCSLLCPLVPEQHLDILSRCSVKSK